MSNINLSFRTFLELQTPQAADYLTQIKDELGIEPEALLKSPQVMAQFNLGGAGYNLSGYSIVNVMRDKNNQISAIQVKLNNDSSQVTRKKTVKMYGKQVSVPDDKSDDTVYTIPVGKNRQQGQPNKMLTQGLSAGGAGSLPGGGMSGAPPSGLPGLGAPPPGVGRM